MTTTCVCCVVHYCFHSSRYYYRKGKKPWGGFQLEIQLLIFALIMNKYNILLLLTACLYRNDITLYANKI